MAVISERRTGRPLFSLTLQAAVTAWLTERDVNYGDTGTGPDLQVIPSKPGNVDQGGTGLLLSMLVFVNRFPDPGRHFDLASKLRPRPKPFKP